MIKHPCVEAQRIHEFFNQKHDKLSLLSWYLDLKGTTALIWLELPWNSKWAEKIPASGPSRAHLGAIPALRVLVASDEAADDQSSMSVGTIHIMCIQTHIHTHICAHTHTHTRTLIPFLKQGLSGKLQPLQFCRHELLGREAGLWLAQ